VAGAPWVVSDELWERIEPLLPRHERRFRYPGRKPASGRAALCGILYVLYTGIAWLHLPRELGFGAGVSCWRRLDAWQREGVWEKLHAVLPTMPAWRPLDETLQTTDARHGESTSASARRARISRSRGRNQSRGGPVATVW
jgi:transposase